MAASPEPALFDAGTICNPAWDIWTRTFGPDPGLWPGASRAPCPHGGPGERLERLRWLVSHHMAFAIPAPVHLAEVARHGPLVEIGAGTGYWAWCLRQMGVDVVAYDLFPPQSHPAQRQEWRGILASGNGRNAWFDCYWTDVIRAGATAAARHGDRTLLLIWPHGAMGHRALEAYTGDRVIFAGEWNTATTNDARLFRVLERHWTLDKVMPMPHWEGTRHELRTFTRALPPGAR